MHAQLIILALLAAGCGRTGTDKVDEGSGSGDSWTEDDTGVWTGPSLSGAIELPEGTARDEELTVGLVRVEFGEGPLTHETIASAPVDADGSWELYWDEAAAEAVAAKPGNDFPLMIAAFYLPMVFVDSDGDGTWDEGETIAGASMDRWVAWLGATVEDVFIEGWSVMDLGLEGMYKPNRCLTDSSLILTARWDEGFPVSYELDQSVMIRLRGIPATLELGGEMSGLGEGHERMLSLPYAALTADTLGDYEPIFDFAAAEGAFSLTLADAPPDSHIWSNDDSWRYSVHVNLLYEDVDDSESWDAEIDDIDAATTCFDGTWTYARHTWPVSDYRGLRLLDCYSGQVGWRTAYTDESTDATVYMDPEESLALEVDPETCSL